MQIMKSEIFILFLVHYSKCENETKIVGGFPAILPMYPYLVSIGRLRSHLMNVEHVCEGVIVSGFHVITAGHCLSAVNSKGFSPLNPKLMSIRAGGDSSKGTNFTQIKNVKGTFIHPECRMHAYGMFYDIGIAVVDSAFRFDNQLLVFPAKIPLGLGKEDSEKLKKKIIGTHCQVVGRGSQDVKSIKKTVLTAELEVINNSYCAYLLQKANQRFVEKQMVCECSLCTLGSYGIDACEGDSGGPLVCNEMVYGIVSYGYGCGRENTPGVFSRIDVFSSWISEITGLSRARSTQSIFLLVFVSVVL